MSTLKKIMLVFLVFGMSSAFAGQASNKNIVQIAASNQDFSTLVTAIKAASLAKTLEGKGPFTVFAPTNEAFAALPKGTLNKLLKNPKELRKILTYHVVSGEILAQNVHPGKVKTVEGQKLKVSLKNGKVEINNATVTKTNIIADNGVIHVINKVLIPS